MGLFDNIIGTASEDIEPLGMEAITDDTKEESTSGGGTGGSGTGTGGSGTGTGGSGTGNNIDTMINIDEVNTGTANNISNGVTLTNSGTDDIPNIDIGGDMDFSSLGVTFEQPIEQTEVVTTTTETTEVLKIENNTENTPTATIVENNTPSLIINTGIDISEAKIAEENIATVESTVVETTEGNSTFSLLDNNITDITPIVAISETIVETPDENSTSLVDIAPENTNEKAPTNSISEVTPTIEVTSSGTSPLSSLNLGYQKNNQENTNHEPLSVRIAAFLKELEELKSNDEVTRTKLEQELVQIREDEKKINDAISLLNNIKNI